MGGKGLVDWGATGLGKGVLNMGVKVGVLMLLAKPVLGQRSKRMVAETNTLFDLTTPF